MNAPSSATPSKDALKAMLRDQLEIEQQLFRLPPDEPPLPDDPVDYRGQTHYTNDSLKQHKPALPGKDKTGSQGQNTPTFTFVPAGNLLRDIGPPDWLVEGYLESGALADLFGPPESYKSFIALDLSCCIGTGIPFHGAKVKQGPVFIIIGEGGRGYGRRLAAWQKANSRFISDYPIYVSTTPAQLMDAGSAADVAKAIEALQEEHGKPELIVIDTLSRNFGPGDENSTKDMAEFVANLDRYIGTDTTRMLVHHTGLQSQDRGRGSSVLRGALDVELKVTRQDNGTVELSCSKMKDAERFKPINFEPVVVDLGLTDDLEPITSLVLQKCSPAKKEVPKLSTQMEKAVNLLYFIGGKSCLRCMSEWQTICAEEQVYTRTSFYKAVDNLRDKGIVEKTGDYVKLSPMYPTVST